MKLSEGLIQELLNTISKNISLTLLLALKDKPNTNEFKLAEKLGLTVNEVRHHLYKLAEFTLVSSIRKKDKKKGWHVSYWTFDNIKARNFLIEQSKKRISGMKVEIKKENEGQYFFCQNKCMRMDQLVALENKFTCTECGTVMTHGNVKKRVADMEKEIARLKKVVEDAEAVKEPTREIKKEEHQKKVQQKKKVPQKKSQPERKQKKQKKEVKKEVKKEKKKEIDSKRIPPQKTMMVPRQEQPAQQKRGFVRRLLGR